MYRSLEYVIFTSYTLRPLCRVILYCNVGWCVKGSAVHRSRQQSLVACVKVTNTFVLLYGSCDVHGIRTTKVCDVTRMYCKEWYMENVPDND